MTIDITIAPATPQQKKNTGAVFRWPNTAAIFVALLVSWAAGPALDAQQLNPKILQQIAAVKKDRDSWTPARKKIHSQLVYAVRQAAGQVIVPGVPKMRPYSQLEADGRVKVRITATVSPALLTAIPALGGTVLSSFPKYNAVYALMPLAQLETLAGREDVRFIGVPPKAINNGGGLSRDASAGQAKPAPPNLTGTQAQGGAKPQEVDTIYNDPEGDAVHGAYAVRQSYGVDGTGVTVGVLSDNIDDGTGDYQTAVADGYVSNVTVIAGQGGTPNDGEGLAMLEVVHRIAPGAKLYFATGNTSDEQFAENIEALQAAGCNIILDDESVEDDDPFQDSTVALAIDAVTAKGVLYFSCAANNGNLSSMNSSCWEGNFVSTANDGYLDFASVVGGSSIVEENGCTCDSAGSDLMDVCLFWAEPLGGATSQYNLYAYDTNNNLVGSADDPVSNTQMPYQILSGTVATGDAIAVQLASGNAEYLHIEIEAQNSYFNNVATNARVTGHNACDAVNSFCVAATPAYMAANTDVGTGPTGPYTTTGPCLFTAAAEIEPFSDDGRRRMFFKPDGTAITPGNFSSTGGQVFDKPDFTAADGVTTNVATVGANGKPFFGTSCATPHAGALAALAWSYNLALTPSQVASALYTGCLEINDPGDDDRDAGAGILMAQPIFNAVADESLPAISGFSPHSGAVGSQVVITGSNFLSPLSVAFGGGALASGSFTMTQEYATVPAGAQTGVITITNAYGSVSTTTNFTVTAAVKTYTVTPRAGVGGSISPSAAQTVTSGGSVTFSATPNSGYVVNQWYLNDAVVQTGSTSYTLKDVTANDAVNVTFTKPVITYTVTPRAGVNGSISPSAAQTVSSGGSITFTATPNSGYVVNQWYLNAVVVQTGSTSYTLKDVTANDAVNVTFTTPPKTYTVTPRAGVNGSISPSTAQTVSSGGSITFTATPNPGYVVNQWYLNAVVVQTGSTSYTLKDVTANDDVNVTFTTAPVKTYTVTPRAGVNGSISPSAVQTVSSGGSITFTATPNPGYVVNQWYLNGVVVQTGSTSYTLKDVTANDDVNVTFTTPVKTYTVTPRAGVNGSISPSTAQTVSSGGSITFNATPNPGYVVNQWYLNAVVVQTGSTSYTLKDVTANDAVNVTFTTPVTTYTVTPSAGVGGSISPSTAQSVASGGSVTFTATPNPGYVVNQWYLNGAAVQTGSTSYTLKDVTANDAVRVGFMTQMKSPVPGSTLTSASVTFQWNALPGASNYALYAGTTAGGLDIYDSPVLSASTLSQTVAGIPTTGIKIYVRLWTMISGAWQYVDYTYTAE